jgi:hypothetical protein
VYLEYLKISSSLTDVQNAFNGQSASVSDLRKSIEKHFDTGYVHILKASDVKIERQGSGYLVRAQYDHRTPFIANVGFIVAFDKSVQINPSTQ